MDFPTTRLFTPSPNISKISELRLVREKGIRQKHDLSPGRPAAQMFLRTVLNISLWKNVDAPSVVVTIWKKSFLQPTEHECEPIVYLSKAKGEKEKSFRLSTTCVSHYGRDVFSFFFLFFLVDGGAEKPNFAHICLNIPTGSMVAAAPPSCSSQLLSASSDHFRSYLIEWRSIETWYMHIRVFRTTWFSVSTFLSQKRCGRCEKPKLKFIVLYAQFHNANHFLRKYW